MKENKRRNRKIIFVALLLLLPTLTLLIKPKEKQCACAEENFSKAECVMELNSRRILYECNGETRLPMASTTKIVTAITVLENCKELDTPFQIPSEAIGVEGSSVYLKEGDVFSPNELLYGLMLRSGNDAATALAIKTSGNIKKFSILMNDTAEKAGALNSNFKNPHGLPCTGHYTTARDLSYITCYAMHNTNFKEIVSTNVFKARGWVNKNKMLSKYPHAIGVKTGYTKEAGRCLVSAAEKEGMTLICTVLSSADMYNRSIKLLEDCFKGYKNEQIISVDDVFEIEKDNQFIKGKVRENFYYPLSEGEKEHLEIDVTPIKDLKNKEIVGQIKISLLKRLIFSGNLYKL